ncbi:unnamed protein product [Pieris macdunnoughi]|uniref:Uncharacterized protein n=1 Tax=Pieris macdunnoughi TaxID=345717 RepID=A0A821WEP0_9NEOP|nr:unnamed protein product [Pieris macdunnoughi]
MLIVAIPISARFIPFLALSSTSAYVTPRSTASLRNVMTTAEVFGGVSEGCTLTDLSITATRPAEGPAPRLTPWSSDRPTRPLPPLTGGRTGTAGEPPFFPLPFFFADGRPASVTRDPQRPGAPKDLGPPGLCSPLNLRDPGSPPHSEPPCPDPPTNPHGCLSPGALRNSGPPAPPLHKTLRGSRTTGRCRQRRTQHRLREEPVPNPRKLGI